MNLLFAIARWLTGFRLRLAGLPVIALGVLSWSALNSAQAQTSATNLPPGIQDVIKLTRAGITEGVILAELQSAGVSNKLSPDQLIYLSNQGVSQNVIRALVQREEPGSAAAPNPGAIAPTGAAPAWAGGRLPSNLSSIHDSLTPYGTWLDVPGYGSCWRPTAATADPNWHPYGQQGRWLYTDCGWYWHSDYSWGDVPFHYGRWFRDKGTWLWAPGNAWAPAWVSWREADGYLGWAPLPPTVAFKPGVGLQFEGAQPANSAFGLGADAFTFVPCDHFWDRNLEAIMLPPDKVAEVFKASVVKNGYRFVNGVFSVEGGGRDRVAALTHREVKIETPPARDLRPSSSEEPARKDASGARKGQQSR